jgi:hypothetical protein
MDGFFRAHPHLESAWIALVGVVVIVFGLCFFPAPWSYLAVLGGVLDLGYVAVRYARGQVGRLPADPAPGDDA